MRIISDWSSFSVIDDEGINIEFCETKKDAVEVVSCTSKDYVADFELSNAERVEMNRAAIIKQENNTGDFL